MAHIVMYDGHEAMPDPLDEFLSYLLTGVPKAQPTPITNHELSSSSFLPAHSHFPVPNSHLTCQWVFPLDPPIICKASLPDDPKQISLHFRNVHEIRGKERMITRCHWYDCPAAPMQQGNLIRHVLTVHLGLLKWRCDQCNREFSRKGTEHMCQVQQNE